VTPESASAAEIIPVSASQATLPPHHRVFRELSMGSSMWEMESSISTNCGNSPYQLIFIFFRTAEVADSLRPSGFEAEEIVERDPYPEVEAQTRRGYISGE